MITYSAFRQAKIIPNLDGLRGIAILLVMLHHIPVIQSPWLHTLQINGRLGVMLFFVISGFLITHLGLKEIRTTGTFSWKEFYIRRGLRIFPLYYAVLALVCLLVFGFNVYPPQARQEFSAKLLSYVFYYSNLTGPIHGPYSLLWSLAVEEQFYLFFSVVFYVLPVGLSRALFFSLALLRLSMLFWGPYVADDSLWLTAFRYQEAILLGVSLAYLLEIPMVFAWLAKYIGRRDFLFCLAMLIGICFLEISLEESAWLETAANVLFMFLVASCVLLPPLFILGGPLLSFMGKISYGLYLYHTIVFYGIKRYISAESYMVFLVGVPLTIFIGALSYRYFESYFLGLKRKFTPS